MIAVIFEVQIQPDQQTRYLTLAEELRPLLSHVAGFISIERFQSLARKNVIAILVGKRIRSSAMEKSCFTCESSTRRARVNI